MPSTSAELPSSTVAANPFKTNFLKSSRGLTGDSFVVKFYPGGKAALRQHFADAFAGELRRTSMPLEELDVLCGFGKESGTTASLLREPSSINGKLAAIVALNLGLQLDDIIKFNLTDENVKEVAATMRQRKLGVLYGEGGREVTDIPLEEQVQVFLALRAVAELDF